MTILRIPLHDEINKRIRMMAIQQDKKLKEIIIPIIRECDIDNIPIIDKQYRPSSKTGDPALTIDAPQDVLDKLLPLRTKYIISNTLAIMCVLYDFFNYSN